MTTLLFRAALDEEKEAVVAAKYFRVETQRSACGPRRHQPDRPPDRLEPTETVIGRYSVLPFYKELEKDLQLNGCQLVNTYRQHQFIADLREWYEVLEGLTPKTWFRVEDVPDDVAECVVKGATNSRKELWKTHMFATTKAEVIEVAGRLMNDTLIGSQSIYVREFVKFRVLSTPGPNYRPYWSTAPLTEEYRFFIYRNQIVASGFYWASRLDELVNGIPTANNSKEMLAFVEQVISRIGDNASAYVVDVGVLEDGSFQVVELNDFQMSGLSCIDPEIFYSRLAQINNP